MTQTLLDHARNDAEKLHKKISANIAKAEAATWVDVKGAQADVAALATKMKTLARDQSDAAKADIQGAIAHLEAAGNLVQDKTGNAVDAVKTANGKLLDSAQKATHSLSAAMSGAMSGARTKLADAIDPK